MNQWMPFVLALEMFFVVNANAGNQSITENIQQIQLPQCLASKISADYTLLAENKSFKIFDIPLKDMDKLSLLADNMHCGRFVNVSHHMISGSKALYLRKLTAISLLNKPLVPTSVHEEIYLIKHVGEVFQAIHEINQNNLINTIHRLAQFYNRSATERTGVLATNVIRDYFIDMTNKYQRLDASFRFVNTGPSFKQRSLVAVLGKDIKAPAVVIGAHLDTLGGRMPGADDDASGAATVLEIARILLESKTPLTHPIYFIWYAAEERGLVGSQRVAEYFKKSSIPVKAVIQLDMTGYRKEAQDTMWLITDYTNPNLTNFMESLIDTYIGVPTGRSQCGYGCSDHASWTAIGVPAVFPFETSFENHNETVHTSKDTIERLSPEHMVNFAKLGLAFAIELAS